MKTRRGNPREEWKKKYVVGIWKDGIGRKNKCGGGVLSGRGVLRKRNGIELKEEGWGGLGGGETFGTFSGILVLFLRSCWLEKCGQKPTRKGKNRINLFVHWEMHFLRLSMCKKGEKWLLSNFLIQKE